MSKRERSLKTSISKASHGMRLSTAALAAFLALGAVFASGCGISANAASVSGSESPRETENVSWSKKDFTFNADPPAFLYEEPTTKIEAEMELGSELLKSEEDQKLRRGIFDSGLTEITLSDIPEYDSEPFAIINDNDPLFETWEYTTDVFEEYSSLDDLGRCGTAYANICRELMPTEKRGDISSVHPSGWYNNPYDFIDGGYVYNRCHLIAYELGAENANERNLITGTRYFNTVGMLPFENMVADYVKETDNHVLYRVTPMYEGDNLVADGVLMEARSVEDNGEGICFCVFCYNVQPGVEIDYATGYNRSDGTMDSDDPSDEEEHTYILNKNTLKFHYPYCDSVSKMNESNKLEYTASRSDIIDMGYSPCGNCRP